MNLYSECLDNIGWLNEHAEITIYLSYIGSFLFLQFMYKHIAYTGSAISNGIKYSSA